MLNSSAWLELPADTFGAVVKGGRPRAAAADPRRTTAEASKAARFTAQG
jgi:hypothetical protein